MRKSDDNDKGFWLVLHHATNGTIGCSDRG
jgi:hypothetical protein